MQNQYFKLKKSFLIYLKQHLLYREITAFQKYMSASFIQDEFPGDCQLPSMRGARQLKEERESRAWPQGALYNEEDHGLKDQWQRKVMCAVIRTIAQYYGDHRKQTFEKLQW